MHGTIHYLVSRARFLLLAVVILLCAVPAAEANRCLAPSLEFDSSSLWLAEGATGRGQGDCYGVGTLYGQPRIGLFVGNNPISNVDPFGLLTAVAIGLPTSSNPFGHAAIATTGNGVVSFGTGTPFGTSFTDYINKQATYRGTVVYILNTTPEQEKAINDYNATHRGRINKYPDNCASRVKGALDAAGIPLQRVYDGGGDMSGVGPVDNFPKRIADALNDMHTLKVSVPQGGTLPPNVLTGFNRKP